jgi:hypothetical protein
MRALLIGRAAVGLCYGGVLAMSIGLPWADFFALLADYLVIDGALALPIAGLFLRESTGTQRGREMWLSVVFLIDAAGRLSSGVAVHVWPGIPGFPVTAVLFLVIMATCTAIVGFAEAWLTAREELARHGRRHEKPQFTAGPVGVASLTSTAFGVAALAFVDRPDSMRPLMAGFMVAAGAVMLIMAWSRRTTVRPS